VNRIIFGNRSGTYGLFISRPGVDVLTATPSQLLLDTSSFINQVVQAGSATLTPGSSSLTITLDSSLASVSNRFLWFTYEAYYSGSLITTDYWGQSFTLYTSGATLYANFGTLPGSPYQYYLYWAVFGGNY
jgi:hypothetical protein